MSKLKSVEATTPVMKKDLMKKTYKSEDRQKKKTQRLLKEKDKKRKRKRQRKGKSTKSKKEELKMSEENDIKSRITGGVKDTNKKHYASNVSYFYFYSSLFISIHLL